MFSLVPFLFWVGSLENVWAAPPEDSSSPTISLETIAHVDLIHSTTLAKEPLQKLFTDNGMWVSEKGRQFGKITVTLKEAVPLSRIEVRSCDRDFVDPAEIFVNDDQGYVFSEGGKKSFRFPLAAGSTVQSFTIGFRYAEDFCVKGISLIRENGAPLSVRVPVPLTDEWKWSGSSLEDAQTLFLSDSRVDRPWIAESHQPDQKLSIHLGQETMIVGLRVWNGHQRSRGQFQNFGRMSQIQVSNEKDPEQLVAVADKFGVQDVFFKKPISGKKISLRAVALVAGRRKGFAVSELRLLTANGSLVASSTDVQSVRADSLKLISPAIHDLLDRSLSFNDDGDQWVLRLRSDGSFFFHGFSDNIREAHSYIYAGTFMTKNRGKEGVDLLLTGFKRANSMILDSDPCGRPCFGPRHENSREPLVQDVLRLQRREKGVIRVFNPMPPARQAIRVMPLKMRVVRSED